MPGGRLQRTASGIRTGHGCAVCRENVHSGMLARCLSNESKACLPKLITAGPALLPWAEGCCMSVSRSTVCCTTGAAQGSWVSHQSLTCVSGAFAECSLHDQYCASVLRISS